MRFWNPDARYRRLTQRAQAWSGGLRTPWQRAHAWFDLIVFDHGFLRLVYRNLHRVSAELWRSAQPDPFELRRLAAEGLRTVVCIRAGRAFGGWPLERETCNELGLDLVELNMRAREAPSREALLEAVRLFERISYPALIHCKSGSDRSGFVAAVYVLARQGGTAREALQQLSLRFGHLKWSRCGILDAVILAYGAEGEPAGLSFADWVERAYDPERIQASFRPRGLSTFIVDHLLAREG